MSVIKILLAVTPVSTSLQVQASGEQSVIAQSSEDKEPGPESDSRKNNRSIGSISVDRTILSVHLQNYSQEHTGSVSSFKAENASWVTHSFLHQRPKVNIPASEAGSAFQNSSLLESPRDDHVTVHMESSGAKAQNSSVLPPKAERSSPAEALLNDHGADGIATAQLQNRSEDGVIVHKGFVSAFEADNTSALDLHATFRNHSGDHAITHQGFVFALEANNATASGVHQVTAAVAPENHEVGRAQAGQVTLLQNQSEVVVGQVEPEHNGLPSASQHHNGSGIINLGKPTAEATTLENRSEDFWSSFSEVHSASKATNASILSPQHLVLDSKKDLQPQEDDAFGDEDQHIQVNVTARSPYQAAADPKDEASKKQARTASAKAAPKFNDRDRNGVRDTKTLENLEWDVPQIRALDFLEHRPSAVEVAAHQSGLMYNVWLVSRAGFGVVVGIAVALMWLLQCSRLCTRTAASPIPRENFDQQVFANVYKAPQSSKISMISMRLAAATTPLGPEASDEQNILTNVYKAAERSKLSIRSSSTPIPTARESYDQRILADVYKVAQARPRVHKSGLEETVAESSRLLRWAASKRSKKKDGHGDDSEAADHFESKNASKRWYDP